MKTLDFRIWNMRSVPPTMMYWGRDFFEIWFKKRGEVIDARIAVSPGNKYFELHILTNEFFRKSMPSCQGEAILMEYTGFQDKSEKKIYEGDILEHESGKIREEVKHEENMWIEEGFMTRFYLTFTSDQYEIIGNIWENRDLLEKK